MSEEFDWSKFSDNFDEMRIVYQEMAKVVVPQFKAYIEMGLSVPEAASLTAAMIAHTLPVQPQKPQED